MSFLFVIHAKYLRKYDSQIIFQSLPITQAEIFRFRSIHFERKQIGILPSSVEQSPEMIDDTVSSLFICRFPNLITLRCCLSNSLLYFYFEISIETA